MYDCDRKSLCKQISIKWNDKMIETLHEIFSLKYLSECEQFTKEYLKKSHILEKEEADHANENTVHLSLWWMVV